MPHTPQLLAGEVPVKCLPGRYFRHLHGSFDGQPQPIFDLCAHVRNRLTEHTVDIVPERVLSQSFAHVARDEVLHTAHERAIRPLARVARMRKRFARQTRYCGCSRDQG